MEYLFYFFLIILAIYLIYLFIRYAMPWVLKGLGVVAIGIMIVSIIVGAVRAIINYVKAVKKCVNYETWVSENKDDEPAIRSYFFGPGIEQVKNTIKTAFALNLESAQKMSQGWTRTHIYDVITFFKKIFLAIYALFGYISIFVFGTVITLFFSAIQSISMLVVMILNAIIFSIVKIIDNIYISTHQINSVCPVCKEKFRMPEFECPDCGKSHKKLVPGPYGIWHHECTCGNRLPSTFLNGRNKLKAKCPYCHSYLADASSRQIEFQLVGATNAGKTVFLAAYYHDFIEKMKKNASINYLLKLPILKMGFVP